MSRYIDAEHLMEKVSRMIEYCEKNKDKKFNALNVLFQVGDAIMDCPTADVVEVVRCKDCKHYESHGNGKYGLCKNYKGKELRTDTDYCRYGERKEQRAYY